MARAHGRRAPATPQLHAPDPYRVPTREEWRRIVRKARTLFPLDAPVRVRRVRMRHASGLWLGWFDDAGRVERHEIRIDERLQRDSAIDALLHEWAHALVEELGTGSAEVGEDVGHDDMFWCCFGELYRTWCREA